MKHWHETQDILRRLLGAEELSFALATVTRIEGSAYRRPGAKLLVESSGAMRGAVSGGCLEADVREIGLSVMKQKEACTRHYDTGTDEDTPWGLGLGCDGEVDLVIQPITEQSRPAWEAAARRLEGDDAFAIATPVEGPAAGRPVVVGLDGDAEGSTGDEALDTALRRRAGALLRTGGTALETQNGVPVFIEVLEPPPLLAVFGAGDDAMPLVRMATDLGFRVAVIDHRPAFLTAERFPTASRLLTRRPHQGLGGLPLGSDDAAVVMMHALEQDRDWTRALADTPVAYIGVLGPRSRIARIRDAVGPAGGDRVYGPVGLDIGADGAEQIALSVLAELLAVRAGRVPKHLREREAAIHA